MVGTEEVIASLTAAAEMIISTVAQWAAVSLSASGVLIDVDGEVEEEWGSCSKWPHVGRQCNPGWVYGGLFLIPLPSWEAKGYDSFCFGVLPQASVYPSHTSSSR